LGGQRLSAEPVIDSQTSLGADEASSPDASPFNNNFWPTPTAQPPRPDADELRILIMRVQAALYSKGLDPGAIDGVMSQKTQTALRTFQRRYGLQVTGTMTTPTLDALGVRL
jgi:His-Xaa-Ser repeat protein HxsA